MEHEVEVEVAVATHNSSLYLRDLLDSLLSQSAQGFTILVSDDCSTDDTNVILEDYRRRFPRRIKLLEPLPSRQGASANFDRLMRASGADYLFLCDHDDVWLEDKVALSLAEMRRAEADHGSETPILVHTDLAVVGAGLEPIHESALSYQNIDPARNRLPMLLMANTVTGCATLMNKALRLRALPIPAKAIMHDHWLALVAAAVGRIFYVPRATILYRQHPGNTIGVQPWRPWSIAKRFMGTIAGTRKLTVLRQQCDQAGALLGRFEADMAEDDSRAAAALAQLWGHGRWRRVRELRRNGLLLGGVVRNAALYYLVLTASGRAGGGFGSDG
jgi:glycosyltransferase involved in cell wall biosynthesis